MDRAFQQRLGQLSQRPRTMIRLQKWVGLSAFLLITASVWLGGCGSVGSIQPLETGEPLMESASLRGKWVTTDGNSQEQEHFQVDSATSDVYFVSSLKPDGKLKVLYKVSLVQVGKFTFLDAAFSETESGEEHRDAQDMKVLPVHFIGRVWIKGDTLQLGLLNYEWLEKMISSEKVKLPFTVHQGNDESLLLLTADSDKLAEFVREYAEDPDAFSMIVTFHRVGPFEEPSAKSNP
jgi:hypothetical protein